MKKISILMSLFLVLACQINPPREPSSEKKATKKVIKDAFKNLTVEERVDAISKASATSENYSVSAISNKDIVSELVKTCGENYQYIKTVKKKKRGGSEVETYQWPRIECTYQQDDGGLSGASAKFLCDFKVGDKVKTRKVKYARDPKSPTDSEVPETILASTTARMLGFYAETYCPAEIVCHNCPSKSPWDLNRAAAAPSTETFEFPWALVEYPIDALTMTNTKIANDPFPQGLKWEDLKNAPATEAGKNLKIEREAWMLWINLIKNWDAEPHNQRLSCLKSKVDENDKPVCEKSIMYTHDYGNSFYRHFQFNRWSKASVFKSSSSSKGCIGGLAKELFDGKPGIGIIMNPVISAEARDLLVQRMEALTTEQWKTLFALSRTAEATDGDVDSWVAAIQEKIQEMKSAKCLPFDENKSVLAN